MGAYEIEFRGTSRSSQRGVSLIELIIALSIVGLLAAFAVPSIQRARDRAQEALVSADLERLGFLQEQHVALGARSYASDLSTLNFVPSPDVAVTVVAADGDGWAAQATHVKEPELHCAVFHTPENQLRPWPAKQPGEVSCGRRAVGSGSGTGGGVLR